jgi:hypothetical protein
LIFGSLRKIDLQRAKTNQVAVHKSKLSSCASLQTSGSLLASVVLERKKKKEIDTRVTTLKQAQNILKTAENKETKALYRLGVEDQEIKENRRNL